MSIRRTLTLLPLPLPLLLLLLPAPTSAAWSADTRLTSNAAPSVTDVDGGTNVVAADGDLFVVWADARDGNWEVYFRERIAGVWNPEERLTSHPAASTQPDIGRTASGELRVIWTDARVGPEIWSKVRSGGTWSADSCLTCDGLPSTAGAIDQRGENLVWEDTRDGNPEIYHRRWDASGTLGPEFRISTDPGASWFPSVASPVGITLSPEPRAPSDPVVVAWQDLRHGNWEIYARYFDGSTWGAETRISTDAGASRHPSVMTEWSGGHLPYPFHAVAWQDDRHGNDEIYAVSGQFGTWGTPWRVTSTPEPSRHPSLGTAWHGLVGPFGVEMIPNELIAWEERNATDTAGSIEVFDLAAGPATASDVGADGTNPGVTSYHSLPAGDRIFEVVWTDERDGNEEIYTSQEVQTLETADGVDVAGVSAAAGIHLDPAQPNPFRTGTEFTLHLERDAELRVQVTDVAGRVVRTLSERERRAGTHRLRWDGRDRHGNPVAGGVYWTVVRSAGEVVARNRLVLVR